MMTRAQLLYWIFRALEGEMAMLRVKLARVPGLPDWALAAFDERLDAFRKVPPE